MANHKLLANRAAADAQHYRLKWKEEKDKLIAAEALMNQLQAENRKLGKDAARYRWLREQHWNNGALAVVASPRDAVKLGHDCPYGDRLDAAIDSAAFAA